MPTSNPRILVADDDPMSRTLLGRQLSVFGYGDVRFAEDGAAALEAIKTDPIDLILLDMQMPKISGIDVLREIKSDLNLHQIPVIVVSGDNEVDLISQCIELGAEDYLEKPVQSGILSARLRNVFERQRLRRAELASVENLKIEMRRSDSLLNAILPPAAVREIKETGMVKARRFNDIVVLFADVANFTEFCAINAPEDVVQRLGALFDGFERITTTHQLEKIKTIGDAFMAVASLNLPLADPLRAAVACGIEMMAATESICPGWQVRVGLARGPVVAGVIGAEKFQFDVWGDTVNVAARMASVGRCGVVTMPQDCWEQSDGRYVGRMLGEVDVKGKGAMRIVECSDVTQ